MRVSCVAVLVLGLLVAVGCSKSQPITPPTPALDGEYRITKMWMIDRWIEPKADFDMIVKGDSMTCGGGCLGKGTNPIKTDRSKIPAEIDILENQDGKIVTIGRGIYKFEGDELTLAVAVEDADPRPQDFSTGERVLVMVLKRK